MDLMTNEVGRIQEQLKRAFAGKAWHGPSVLELLADVDATRAAAHPIPGAHSIWELVLHIAAWNKAAVRRLSGDRAQLEDEENFPPVADTSDKAWQQTIENLKRAHRELHYAIESLEESRLDQPIIAGMSTVYGTLHGVIQHNLYHAGQIALLKKVA
jgi:uncharacterized damage-inducible protein DinB